MEPIITKLSSAVKVTVKETKQDRKIAKQAIKNYVNRLKKGSSLMQAGAIASETYKKNHSKRDAIKQGFCTFVDCAANSAKDLGTAAGMLNLARPTSIFVSELLKK